MAKPNVDIIPQQRNTRLGHEVALKNFHLRGARMNNSSLSAAVFIRRGVNIYWRFYTQGQLMHMHDACNYKMPQSGLTHCPDPLFINPQHLALGRMHRRHILALEQNAPLLRCTFSDLRAHGRTRDLSDDKSLDRSLCIAQSTFIANIITYYCCVCDINTCSLCGKSVFFRSFSVISGALQMWHILRPARFDACIFFIALIYLARLISRIL